jgi:proton-dependent oligopeptide transporter, POT family
MNDMYDFFMLFVFMAGAAALILFLLTRQLQKMMHNRDNKTTADV